MSLHFGSIDEFLNCHPAISVIATGQYFPVVLRVFNFSSGENVYKFCSMNSTVVKLRSCFSYFLKVR